MDATTVSRRLDRLSEELGETLFHRRGYKLEATDASKPLIHIAETLETSLDDQCTFAQNPRTRHFQARLSVELPILDAAIAPGLAAALSDQDNFDIEICNDSASLALGETDVHVGYDEPLTGRLVRRRVGDCECAVYAAAQFADQIEGWVRVGYAGAHRFCEEELKEQFFGEARATLPSLTSAQHLVENMPLAVMLPRNFARRFPHLVELVDLNISNVAPVWMSFHESRRRDPAVRIVCDFVMACFTKGTELTAPRPAQPFELKALSTRG